ncbi:hypothetical protein DERF_001437 [Dermatophagoides farinae]|uniref:Uncharacterized protein n=1 Tax=Dermatophagoides farinae TaxID=6954 RepID=A0A922L9M7_DERFA|nr:hypothetical protein DERF_001437 [Dermatophagoides farinae]
MIKIGTSSKYHHHQFDHIHIISELQFVLFYHSNVQSFRMFFASFDVGYDSFVYFMLSAIMFGFISKHHGHYY